MQRVKLFDYPAVYPVSDEKLMSGYVLIAVGGLILLLIVFMIVIICLIYWRK